MCRTRILLKRISSLRRLGDQGYPTHVDFEPPLPSSRDTLEVWKILEVPDLVSLRFRV